MPLKTKRWNDTAEAADSYRLLICRYRPRGVSKKDQPWDDWWPELGPSKKLHADFYGKNGPPITWEEYRQRYLEEMQAQQESIRQIVELIAEGKTITLLCSSACVDEAHCHRTLLRQLVEAQVEAGAKEKPPEQTADPR